MGRVSLVPGLLQGVGYLGIGYPESRVTRDGVGIRGLEIGHLRGRVSRGVRYLGVKYPGVGVGYQGVRYLEG